MAQTFIIFCTLNIEPVVKYALKFKSLTISMLSNAFQKVGSNPLHTSISLTFPLPPSVSVNIGAPSQTSCDERKIAKRTAKPPISTNLLEVVILTIFRFYLSNYGITLQKRYRLNI